MSGKLKPAPHRPVAERLLEWTAPTGRRLVPGTTFRHSDHSGLWRFVTYVDHPRHPHVEATRCGGRTTKGRANVRALEPAGIHSVSNEKGGAER